MGDAIGAILATHGVTETRGFLPTKDPLERFPTEELPSVVTPYLEELDALMEDLPRLLDSGEFRSVVRRLDEPPAGLFDVLDRRETVRLCQVSSFLASGFVHQPDSPAVDRLPAATAIPLYRTSVSLGRKPILAYDVLCLHNFRRRSPTETDGFELDNLDAVHLFTDLEDERWFTIIHVAIEAAAGPALVACARAQRAIAEDDHEVVRSSLETMAESLTRQTSIMRRMTEGNAPEAFVHEFRPYYEGFDGIVFEGVDELGGEPQTLRGGSGAQSSALPAIDAALGIEHESTELIDKLEAMRSYMPGHHREVISAFEAGPDIRRYVASVDDPALVDAFNRSIDGIVGFRNVHLEQVAQYIRKLTGETTGTGGTDYMKFLPLLREETTAQKL